MPETPEQVAERIAPCVPECDNDERPKCWCGMRDKREDIAAVIRAERATALAVVSEIDSIANGFAGARRVVVGMEMLQRWAARLRGEA